MPKFIELPARRRGGAEQLELRYMDGIVSSLRRVEACHVAVEQCKEQAPASPGPNADITTKREVMQAAINSLTAVFEGAGFTINSVMQRQLATSETEYVRPDPIGQGRRLEVRPLATSLLETDSGA